MKIYIDQRIHDTTPEWYSYTYLGEGSHQYCLSNSHESGGFNDSPYITVDDSMWTIDTPESPQSILALIIPSITHQIRIPPLDLCNIDISFSLRGDDLQLYGARCYFWVLTFLPASTRWHYISQPLNIPNGKWSTLQKLTLHTNESLWHCSFSRRKPRVPLNQTLGHCMSFGFSFVGFSEKVVGKLSLSEFTIHKNIDTKLMYFAKFHNFDDWLAINCGQGRQLPAPIDQKRRCVLLNDDNYMVLVSNGTPYLYLAFVKRTQSTQEIQIVNKNLFFTVNSESLTPVPRIDYKGGNMHFFVENTLTNTIWVHKQPIPIGTNIGKIPIKEDKNDWFRLMGYASLDSVLSGEKDYHGYDYMGFMLLGVTEVPTGYWSLFELCIM